MVIQYLIEDIIVISILTNTSFILGILKIDFLYIYKIKSKMSTYYERLRLKNVKELEDILETIKKEDEERDDFPQWNEQIDSFEEQIFIQGLIIQKLKEKLKSK